MIRLHLLLRDPSASLPGPRPARGRTALLLAAVALLASLRGQASPAPTEPEVEPEPGHFVFDPAPEPTGPDADAGRGPAVDLRARNEAIAGPDGRIRPEGPFLVRGDGVRVRLWGVSIGAAQLRLGAAPQRALVRSLARRGVDLVRVHAPLFDCDARQRVDEARLADLHRFVRVAAAEGVYTALSLWSPRWFDVTPADGIAGFEKRSGKAFGLLFTEPKLRHMWKGWAERILTSTDPQGADRTPLARHPALAWIELVDGDGLFGPTARPDVLSERQWHRLERAFALWAKERYGSIEKTQEAWGAAGADTYVGTRLLLLPAGRMAGAERERRTRRVADQVLFLARFQRGIHEELATYLRDTLGVESMISCGDADTVDAGMLDAVERWTYLPGDLLERHASFAGRHEGEGAAHSVRVEHTYEDRSAFREPLAMPVQTPQTADRPVVMSRVAWPAPNRFRSEMPLLCAAYGALQGVDGFCFAAVEGPSWADRLSKSGIQHPDGLAQFPAFALAFRRGDIAEADAVATLARPIERLARDGMSVSAALELGRRRGRAEGEGDGSLAYLIGKVERRFVLGLETDSRTLRRDARRSVLDSATDELSWNTRTGVVTVSTPRFVACGGFTKGRRQSVRPFVFDLETKSDYAVGAVVSLDDEPLTRSEKMLLQLGSSAHPAGFATRGDEITDLGRAPWQVERIEGRLTWSSDVGIGRVRVLDANLVAGAELELGDHSVELPGDALYLLLER